jgi:hypothetical protein
MWSRAEYLSVVLPLPRTYNFLAPRYEVFPEFLLVIALLLPSRVSRGLLTSTRPVVPSAEAAGTAEPGPDGGAAGFWGRITGGQSWRVLSVVTVIWLGVAIVPSFQLVTDRSTGPLWAAGYYAAVEACEQLPGSTVEVVPISPRPNWKATYTCDELTD